MDKGIRNGVNVQFAAMLPQLATLGGKAFRRQLLDWTVEQFGCSMAAASTHYNFAKHAAVTADATLVLGRPAEKNNGGRKKGSTNGAAKSTVFAPFETAADYKARMQAELDAHSALTPDVEVQTVFAVRKKSDDSEVAANLSFEDAQSLINRAAAQKKAKLYMI